jgi:hypothetical protein
MSSEELLVAYADGEISRRTLMRRLVAAGVSIGAAATYAHALAPAAKAESASLLRAEYPEINAKINITSGQLQKVINKEKVNVRVRTDKGGKYKVFISLVDNQGVFVKSLGEKAFHLDKNDPMRVSVPIKVGPLKGRNKANIGAYLAYELPGPRGYFGEAYDTRTLD